MKKLNEAAQAVVDPSARTRTEILDLSQLGPELDEGQLMLASGGLGVVGAYQQSQPTGGSCGGCH